MAVTLDDIKALRTKTGAGMSDCKKALTEAEGDFEKAIEIIRKKGLAVAAKRSDREASEGCVLVKVDGNFGAIIALKCETDFVANNKDFIALTESILDACFPLIIGKNATVSSLNRNGQVTRKKFPIIRSVAHIACNSERQSNI